MTKVYIKNGQTLVCDTSNLFVYESSVYLHMKNYYSLMNKKYFSSPVEIPGVVGSFFKNSRIQICSELFAAPEAWLLENDFIEYIKIKKEIKKKNENTMSN